MKTTGRARSWTTRVGGVLGLVLICLLVRMALKERTSDELYQISSYEMPSVVAAANKGSPAAAARLRDHYQFWAQDQVASNIWRRRAAELGDQSSQDELIGELSRSHAEKDRSEAKSLAARWARPLPR